MENKKFHIVRVKGKEDSTFYDPCTDIRVMFPCAVELASGMLDENKQNYIKNCLYTMQLRLKEDATPLNKQLDLFVAAINKLPPTESIALLAEIGLTLMTLYAIYGRRDRRLLGPDQENLISAAKLISSHFFTTVSDKVKQMAEDDQPPTRDSFAVCEETGEIMTHVREMAARTVNADGASWDELAALCDKAFAEASGNGDKSTMVSLALAYPSYKEGDLSVDVEAGDE